ncbi:glycosyltransferase family 92 protein RCOM_0530710-like [Rutidosis leptorrhynchoides]|uniref:glycosyltransferase family 92 protein RCOM_0530710-like n=1 Tax=Rutidosis leptorrhynchoides TaxID=125765 RepID=UPI003A99E131
MDSPEQRRKRKRLLKTTNFRQFPPVRSILYFFGFFVFFYLLFRRHTVAFHHVITLTRFSSFSSYQIDSVSSFSKFNEENQFKIEARVSFPDHILLLVTGTAIKIGNKLECVYKIHNSDLDSDPDTDSDIGDGVIDGTNVLSVEEYNDNGFLVRCPLPSVNDSSLIGLKRRSLMISVSEDKPLNSWENLVYEAVLDGNTNTVLVFVKGISHRQDKESDPTQFSCHFGLGEGENGAKYMLTSRAVTAAQEVVRCVLPRSILMHPEKALGVRATVSFRMPRVRGRARRVVLPSVAKIASLGSSQNVEKHELCVCTMLWNQAHSIREWITYHSWLGVEKWFIYDNNSDDDIKDVINDLDFEGYNVSRHVWPWIKTQEAGFSHCAMRARSECNWVSFMDVDEFYYFPHNSMNEFRGQGSLKTLVSNFTTSLSIGEIRTSCHSFGPSGLTTRPKRGVTVGYTCRLQSPERHKSIIRPDALDTTLMNVVHHFHLSKGFTFKDLPQSVAVINHYKYQVWEVFRAKFYRRVATYVADWKDNQNEGSRDRAPGLGTEAIEPPDWRLQFCEVWDTGLRDYVLTNLGDVSNGVLPWDGRSM